MNNTNTNNTNNTNENNKEVKARRSNRKIIASVCAVIAATAMITGIAVFTASAHHIENAPARQTVTTAVSQDSSSKAETTVKTSKPDESKKAEKASGSSKSAAETVKQVAAAPQQVTTSAKVQPVQQTQTVNGNGKHPGESGYAYKAEPVNAAASKEDQPEIVKHPEECGFNYQAVIDNYNATAVASDIYSGDFTDCANNGNVLTIAKANDFTAYCTVKMAKGNGEYTVYGFMGIIYGDKMYYTSGTKNAIVYDANGNVVSSQELDCGHSGHVVMTKEGLVWVDSDETHIVFAY